MKEITLEIDGMHYTGCSKSLENGLKNKSGIKEVEVNFDTKKAHIIYKKIDKKAIEKYIEDLGFKSKGE